MTLYYDKVERINKADRINNETLAKLTADEIGLFGLYNLGVFTYRGELKSRRQGYKTEKVNEIQTNFTSKSGTHRFEFIQNVDGYAARLYDIDDDAYSVDWQVLWAIDFLR